MAAQHTGSEVRFVQVTVVRYRGNRILIYRVTQDRPDTDPATLGPLEGAVDRVVAQKLVEPGWNRLAQCWVAPAAQGYASLAEQLTAVQGGWHDLLLGNPVRATAGGLGLSERTGEFVGEVASAVQLPGDAVVHSIVRLVQFAGVLVGVATGNPLLANASVKSLAHDALTDVATRAVRETVAGLLRPLPPRDIPPPPPPGPNQRPARTRDGLRPGALRSDQRVPPAAGTTPHRGVAPPPSRRPDPGRGAPGMSRL